MARSMRLASNVLEILASAALVYARQGRPNFQAVSAENTDTDPFAPCTDYQEVLPSLASPT